MVTFVHSRAITEIVLRISFYFHFRPGRVGSQVVVPFRGDEHGYRHLRLMGDLGQNTFLVRTLAVSPPPSRQSGEIKPQPHFQPPRLQVLAALRLSL